MAPKNSAELTFFYKIINLIRQRFGNTQTVYGSCNSRINAVDVAQDLLIY